MQNKTTEEAMGFGEYMVICQDKFGNIRFTEKMIEDNFMEKNKIVNQGIEDMFDTWQLGKTSTPYYMFLTTAAFTPLASSTMANVIAGAPEYLGYSETNRPLVVLARTGTTLTNTASKAVFTIVSPNTIYGCGLQKSSAKGNTSEDLCSYSNFSSPRPVFVSDTLTIQWNYTLVSA